MMTSGESKRFGFSRSRFSKSDFSSIMIQVIYLIRPSDLDIYLKQCEVLTPSLDKSQ